MDDNPEQRRPWRAPMVAAGLVILLVTGCGPRGEAGAGAGPTPTNVKAQAAKVWQEFVKCARTHGVPSLPDPKVDSDGDADFGGFEDSVPVSTQQKVEKACGSILKKLPASQNKTRPPASAAQIAALKKFTACMRKHGQPNWPDPQANGRFKLDSNLKKLLADGPKQWERHIKPCRSLLDKSGAQARVEVPPGQEPEGSDK